MCNGIRIVVAAALLTVSAQAFGVLVANDSYDSTSSGYGWSGGWTLDPSASIATTTSPLSYTAKNTLSDEAWTVNGGSSVLRVAGASSDTNLAYRSLANSQSGDVWVSFLLRWNKGAVGDNDFLVYWFDNNHTTDHTSVPNIGIKTNEGGGGTNDMVVRLTMGTGDYAGSITTNSVETHLLVGHLYKTTPGANSAYNAFEMWVDPGQNNLVGDAHAPAFVYAIDKTAISLKSFGMIGMRSANLTSGQEIFVDELSLGTTMADVMQGVGGAPPVIPEPLTMLGVIAGMGGVARYVRKLRAQA